MNTIMVFHETLFPPALSADRMLENGLSDGLGQIIDGVTFRDGEPIEATKDHAAA